MHFGEGGDTEFHPSPDQTDYQSTYGRDHSGETEQEDGPEPVSVPAVQEPPGSVPSAGDGPQTLPGQSRTTPAARGSDWPQPRMTTRPVKAPHQEPGYTTHAIPFPKRRSPSAEAPAARGTEGIVSEGEELRDAPAPQNPYLYSLWAGLSKPLLLPSSRVGDVSPSKAKQISGAEYDSRILGGKDRPASLPAETRLSGVVGGAGGRNAAPPSAEAADLHPQKGLFAVLELDVSDQPGRYRDVLKEVRAATGFRVDERTPPHFMDPGKTRVRVHGWIRPERMTDLVVSDRVNRLELDRADPPALPEGGMTDILLGIRIPPQSSPNQALVEAVTRLTLESRFELGRAIGYQPVPGTNEMVMIVSGKLPVREMSQVLADPSVVKVAPSPKKPETPIRAPSSSGSRRWLPFLMEHPAVVLITLILSALLLLPSLRRRD